MRRRYSRAWSFFPGFSSVYTIMNNDLTAVFQGKEDVQRDDQRHPERDSEGAQESRSTDGGPASRRAAGLSR